MDSTENRPFLYLLAIRRTFNGDWGDLLRLKMAITKYTDEEGNYYELESDVCGFSTLSVMNPEGIKVSELHISNQQLLPLLADLHEVVEQ
jgi:hypothetical protein